MAISLARDVEAFLEEQVRAGVATTPSDLANDVIRSLRDQQRKAFEFTPELEVWFLDAAAQPANLLTRTDFDGIRERVRAWPA